MILIDPEDAIAEASFAFNELGADGLVMPTNIGAVYLGDPLYDPLLAEPDRRGLVVFVHPMALPCPLIPGIPAHGCDFLLSTVRAATTACPQRSPRRFPGIRFILTHAGGFIPYAVQRMSLALSQIMGGRSPESLRTDYRAFFCDTADEVTFFARQLDDLQLDTVCSKRSHEQTQPRCFRDFAISDLRRPRTGCKAQRRTSGRAILSDEAAHPR
jgi:predicted TIM-barrel fold metal-dependent hydrolase